MKIKLYALIIASLCIATAPPAAAQVRLDSETYAVRLSHVDRHPATLKAARRTLARIEDAALSACGASGFSLKELNRATRRSVCWRNSMKDALAKIDDPLLNQTYQRGR